MSPLETRIRQMTDQYTGWGDRVDGFVKTIIEICEHYAEQLELEPVAVFEAMEDKRHISYPNHYQWLEYPRLDDGKVLIFKTQEEMYATLKPKLGFICPACNQISADPYECNSGAKKESGKPCDWKSYGLFGTMGKGLRFTISENWLDHARVEECFMPVAICQDKEDHEQPKNDTAD